MEWVKLLLLGTGFAAVIAVGISHLASAFGNRLQEQFWPDWPHDSPTNRWLHPNDHTVSKQQKAQWHNAIHQVVGLDIEKAIRAGNPEEIKAIINDAVKALRGRFWNDPNAKRIRLHNIDYGFARNLTGLRPLWLTFAIGSALGCWAGYIWIGRPLLWCVVSSLVVVAAFTFAYTILPDYVRRKAHYYAESFFDALTALDAA